ncbi:MAG: hypothetical protein ACKOK8_05180 [Planctomycetia bacterium]
MSARKPPPAAIALGKRCERGLRRLRHGLRDAYAAVSLLRAARRADVRVLAGRAAGLIPPDLILCCRADAAAAAEDCRRVLHALATGPLPPRKVWTVAAAVAPDETGLAGLRAAVAAAGSGHVILCDTRATICDDALAWIAAVLEPHDRSPTGRGPLAVYGDEVLVDPGVARRSAMTVDHKPHFSYPSLLAGSFLGPIVAFDRALAIAALDRLIARGLATTSPGESLYAVALEALRGCASHDVAHVQHPLSVRATHDAGTPLDDTARIASAALDASGVLGRDDDRHVGRPAGLQVELVERRVAGMRGDDGQNAAGVERG